MKTSNEKIIFLKWVPRRIFFRGSNFREITTKRTSLYKSKLNISRKLTKLYKKLFYLPKKNKIIYFDNRAEKPN
jgi:hypothetical protein